MKITVTVFSLTIMIIAVAAIVVLTGNYSETSQDKLRVAFFPSIGHAVPIVGLENGIFQRKLASKLK